MNTDGDIILSSWTNFPTQEDPTAKYKFASFAIQRESDKLAISRSAYGVLDWLGDWGGLMDALKMIGELIIMPFSGFRMMSTLAGLFITLKPENSESKSESDLKVSAFKNAC